MQFKADDRVYDTCDMVSLDVEGIYFTIYLDAQHHMVFYQTFDDEQGVMISAAPPDQANALLRRFGGRNPGDISPYRDWLRELNPSTGHPSSRSRNAADRDRNGWRR